MIAVILRSAQLESSRIEDNISRMVMTNFETCCQTKQGCAVVEACLEKFSVDNKLMIAEQLLEMDTKEQLTEFWTHGRYLMFMQCKCRNLFTLHQPCLYCESGSP